MGLWDSGKITSWMPASVWDTLLGVPALPVPIQLPDHVHTWKAAGDDQIFWVLSPMWETCAEFLGAGSSLAQQQEYYGT